MVAQFRMLRTLMFFLVFAGFVFQFPLSPVLAEKSPDEILAGVHRNFPPQYSIDEKTGKPTGFAIDIMDEVARRAGLKVRYVIFDEWPLITQALKEGRIDIIPNDGIIEERKADMDFTSPVEAFQINIFVRKTTTDVHIIDDLQGWRVAVVSDNKGLLIIREYGRAKPVIFDSLYEALLSLLSGNTDALVYPGPPVILLARQSQLEERIKMVGQPLLEVKRAIAVGKGKTELFNKLNKEVIAFIATPEYAKIYSRWYGAPEPYWNIRRVLILAGVILVLAIVIFSIWHYLSLTRLNRDLKYSLEEQKKAEEVIRRSEELFKVITSSTPDHLLVQDSDLRYLFVMNPQLGLTEQDMIGKTDYDFLSKEDADKLTEIKRQVLKTGRSVHVEVPLISSKGEQQFFDGTYIPKFDAKGHIDGLIGYFRNVTERKQAEEKIRASLREKDILLNEIHHRVKNNLQVMSGLLKLQARASKNREVIESFNESQDRIRSMALVHEKLYNSKDFSRIDLAGYVRSLSEELFKSHNINSGKIDLTIQTNGEVHVDIIKAIPCGLIMNELISNALKHAFPGDGPGKLQIIIGETKDTEIEIIVRDNGLGLPDDVDIHEVQSVGLHLVNGLVKNQLDGQIEVKRDNGTEFRITYPL